MSSSKSKELSGNFKNTNLELNLEQENNEFEECDSESLKSVRFEEPKKVEANKEKQVHT